MALPPDLAALATAQQRRQQQIALLLVQLAGQQWARLDPSDVATSWDRVVGPLVFALTASAQREAARGAQQYVAAAVAAQGIAPDPAGVVVDDAFAGVASDGRPLDTLLEQPALEVGAFLSGGMATAEALQIGMRHLERMLVTQIADAARAATGVAQAVDRRVHGYIRQVTPGACSRCLILAGRFYRWSSGFARHPHCHCVHVPATSEHRLKAQDPQALVKNMTDQQLRKAGLTAGDIKALHDGADLFQIVNAHRGLQSVQFAGQTLNATTEGITRRALAGKRLEAAGASTRRSRGERVRRVTVPRITPEQIYQLAGADRDTAIRLLRRYGFIL